MLALPELKSAAEILGPDGPFASVFASFEWRHGQQEMTTAVAHTLEKGGVALVEAGTGTGKSLAYLVPAALYALKTGNKVVISTNTINLQEQLLHKDIPLVQEALAPDLQACLVKGWRNYLCLYRLAAVTQYAASDPGETEQLNAIAAWANHTSEGSVAEFSKEPDIWEDVCAESDTCLRADCPLQPKCFFFRARARMDDAHLLVVNHHLLFADVAVRRSVGWDSDRAVLPRYKHVILDEAHHVERVATDFLSSAMSEYAMNRLVYRLYNHRSSKSRGVLALVSAKASQCIMTGGDLHQAEQVHNVLEREALPALERLATGGQQLFAAVSGWLRQGDRSVGRIRSGEEQREWQAMVGPPANSLAESAAELAGVLRKLKTTAASLLQDDPGVPRELDALALRCHGYAELAAMLGAADDEDRVFWVDAGSRKGQVRAMATPLDVGPAVREWIDHLESLVCTSATMTVAGSFSFIRSRMGLTKFSGRVAELIIQSPFRYAEQALVGVPVDLPEPTSASYPDALAAAVQQLVLASRGRAFVLFTSYALLRHVAQRLAPLCENEGWPLLVQGQEGRSRMLAAFRAESSVLLGTDSFWEGVDVPGEALSCVILTRLPFRVPDDPVVEARMEAMRRQGLDPFYNYAMPEAVLKFKQGFGRLIRSRSDKGVVVICDRRILERRYGRLFLASLPECASTSGSLDNVAEAVRAWV